MAASAGETVQHEGLGLSETEVAYAVSAPFGAGIDTVSGLALMECSSVSSN